MAAEVNLEPSFSTGAPEPLFRPRARDLPMPQWDVTADGERVLVVRAAGDDDGSEEPLTLVQNWTSDLERQ
jgi:hypothetical protein